MTRSLEAGFVKSGVDPEWSKTFAQIVARHDGDPSPANRLSRDIVYFICDEVLKVKPVSHIR